MWMGYSQLLCSSGEQMLLGSLQVIMSKVAQSRQLWSKPPEAETWSGPGGKYSQGRALAIPQPGTSGERATSLCCPDVLGREDFWQAGDTLPDSTTEPVSYCCLQL